VGNSEGKRALFKHRRRWEDNIKMDLQEVGCVAWTGLIWLRKKNRWWAALVNKVMNLWVP
jgi:hypothetical protein